MHSIATIRRTAILLLLSGCTALSQSPTLPATPPTQLPSPAASSKPALATRHPANVSYSDGLLEVDADNSSLNQILRAIAGATGMSINGGVIEQRVFGKYGPGKPAEVLASLLEGTGTNMVLRQSQSELPLELFLTPQHGGPSPPSPSATAYEDALPANQRFRPPFQPAPSPDAQPQPAQPGPTPQSSPPPEFRAPQPPQSDPAPGFVSAPTIDPETAPGTTPGPQTQSTGTSDPPSPNGVKTPQQIYEELQQLQQKQQQH